MKIRLIPWHPVTWLCLILYWCISALAFLSSGIYPPVVIILVIAGSVPLYINWLLFDITYRKYSWRYSTCWADVLIQKYLFSMIAYTVAAAVVLLSSYLAFKEQPMLILYSYAVCTALLLIINAIGYTKENSYDQSY